MRASIQVIYKLPDFRLSGFEFGVRDLVDFAHKDVGFKVQACVEATCRFMSSTPLPF